MQLPGEHYQVTSTMKRGLGLILVLAFVGLALLVHRQKTSLKHAHPPLDPSDLRTSLDPAAKSPNVSPGGATPPAEPGVESAGEDRPEAVPTGDDEHTPANEEKRTYLDIAATLGPSIARASDERLQSFIQELLIYKDTAHDPKVEERRLERLKVVAGQKARLRKLAPPTARSLAMNLRQAYGVEYSAEAKAAILLILDSLPSQELVIDLAIRAISDNESYELRTAAIAILVCHESEPGVMEQLCDLARGDPDPAIRDQVIRSLPIGKDPRALDTMLWAIEHDRSSLVRATAVLRLAEAKPPGTESLISRVLGLEAEPTVRMACLTALSKIGTDSAWQIIQSAHASDKNVRVRGAAGLLLEKRGSK